MSKSSFAGGDRQPLSNKRNVKQVPFVELFNGRLQGVVSSGSDIERVYVSFFEAKTLDFCCSTNNNRPCGGLGSSPCKHLQNLLGEAIAAYGSDQVVNYLKVPGDISQILTAHDILQRIGNQKRAPASEVFSRFLNYLRYVELGTSYYPLPEMSWFIG